MRIDGKMESKQGEAIGLAGGRMGSWVVRKLKGSFADRNVLWSTVLYM